MIILFLAQIQVMDFVTGLKSELAIIINESNLIDLDEAEKMAKNVKSVSLINKNVITAVTNPAVTKVKKLKAQILKLKAKIKEAKYVSRCNVSITYLLQKYRTVFEFFLDLL